LTRLTRMVEEEVRDGARAVMRTGLYKRSMVPRRQIERHFAKLKVRPGLTRLHLRGWSGANEPFLVGAAILDLRLLARTKLASRVLRPRRAYRGREQAMDKLSRIQVLSSRPLAA
jgi:hypothetical protein